ncbi:MAG: hypothetical protein KatS3mg124_1009 [Porticoccaceae bacterium]|nr:MAG: hypothetical protein KatS3mg124_1009 [Porticoccaceae bacterium]
MVAITADTAAELRALSGELIQEIAALLFNEPFEAEAFVEQMDRLSAICWTLHQPGAVELAEELVRAVQHLTAHGERPAKRQAELAGLLELFPRLFGELHRLPVASPFLFLPELAALRRLQGKPPLYEFQLVRDHNWPPSARFRASCELSAEGRAALRKLKSLYQVGLLELLRNGDRPKGLAILGKVAAKLAQLFPAPPENRYWRLVGAAVQGFAGGELALNPVRLRLLAAVERQLKALLDGAEESRAFPLGLWRAYGILLALRRRRSAAEEELLHWVGAPHFDYCDLDVEAARAVVVGGGVGNDASLDELAQLAAALHTILEQADGDEPLAREEVLEFVRIAEQVAERCAALGLSQAAERFLSHRRALDGVSGEQWRPEAAWMREVAHSLLYLECLLAEVREGGVLLAGKESHLDRRPVDEVVAGRLYDTSVHAVWQQCLALLEDSKEKLDEVATGLAGPETAPVLAETFATIGGAAWVVGDARVAEVARRCGRFVRERLFSLDEQRRAEVLATFADSVAALEFHLREEGRGQGGDYALDLAADNLAELEAA